LRIEVHNRCALTVLNTKPNGAGKAPKECRGQIVRYNPGLVRTEIVHRGRESPNATISRRKNENNRPAHIVEPLQTSAIIIIQGCASSDREVPTRCMPLGKVVGELPIDDATTDIRWKVETRVVDPTDLRIGAEGRMAIAGGRTSPAHILIQAVPSPPYSHVQSLPLDQGMVRHPPPFSQRATPQFRV
jgi:hypothetical protein